MKQKVVCPNCGTAFVRDASASRPTCPFCAFRNIPNPRTEEESNVLRLVEDDEVREDEAQPDEDSSAKIQKPRARSLKSPKRKRVKLQTFGQFVLLGGLVWFFLGIPIALSMPSLSLSGSLLRGLLAFVQLVVTPVLIFLNLSEAVRQVRRTGKVLAALPHTLAQLLLFPLFFFQIYCIFGASSYSFERSPTGLDWTLFALVHAFRAADLLDTVQAFQIDLLSIRPNSIIVSALLILYHLVVDFFMVALLIRGYELWRRRQNGGMASYLARNPEEIVLQWRAGNIAITKGWFALWGVFFLFWTPTAFWFDPWNWSDIWRWPLDNCIRVIDFLDLMDLGSFRLHGRSGLWEGFLALFFRLLVAGVLIGLLSAGIRAISLRWLGGFGLDESSLEEISLAHPDESGDAARERLAVLLQDDEAKELATNPTRWLPLEGWLGVLTAFLVAILPTIYLSRWDGVVDDLTSAAVDVDESRAASAVQGLERFGPRAEKAVPLLIEGLPKLPPERQREIIRLFGMLGGDGRSASARYLFGTDNAFAEAALFGLKQTGGVAVGHLFQGCVRGNKSIREPARKVLLQMGEDGARGVLQVVTEKDALLALPILDEMNPNWPDLRTSNKIAQRIQLVSRARRTLQTSNNALELAYAAKDLESMPSYAKYAEKDLINVLERESYSLSISERVGFVKVDVRKEVEKALTSISEFELRPFIAQLESKDARQVLEVLAKFKAMGPKARGALEPLKNYQPKAPVGLQDHVRDCIAAISPSSNAGGTSANNAKLAGRGPATGEAPPPWGEWTPVGRGTVWVALPKNTDAITVDFYALSYEQKKYGWRVKLSLQGIRNPVHLEGTEADIKQTERKHGIRSLLTTEMERIQSAYKVAGKEFPWAPGFPSVATAEFFGTGPSGMSYNDRRIGLADASKIFRVSAIWQPTAGDDTRALGAIMNSLRVDTVPNSP